MPELPDLLYVRARLIEELIGGEIDRTRLVRPVVLRCLVPGDLDLLTGARLLAIDRVAHFLVFRFAHGGPGGSALQLAVNPMLAGKFQLSDATAKDPAALCFALKLGARELRYLDDKQMGKAYLLASGPLDSIPGMKSGGADVLSRAFTLKKFTDLLSKRRDQVRAFLLDKTALDSLGNAYADEVLFAAGVHPKSWCRSLSSDEIARLHRAIVSVLKEAMAEITRRKEPIEVKVRDFLKVRGKTLCPRCGLKIRKAGVLGMDAYFCPKCQPATRAQLVDWTRTGK